MRLFALTDALCDRLKLPHGWEAYKLEAIGSDAAPQVLLTGGVYPEMHATGARKGRPNYKKPVAQTECKIVVSLSEYREIVAAIKVAERIVAKGEGDVP